MAQQSSNRVRKLITEYKNTRIRTTPAEICRHVATECGISVAAAAELIQRSARQDVAQKHRLRPAFRKARHA